MIKKKVLFMVGSSFQLMNAISIRLTECCDAHCDLILRSATTWDKEMLDRLDKLKIFTNVYCPNLTEEEKSFWFLKTEEQRAIYDNPLLFLKEYFLYCYYDELYIAVIHNSWRLIYYYHIMNGRFPKVFMFDEGIRSYTLDISQLEESEYLKGDYAKFPLIQAVKAFYLLQPNLYTIKNYDYELRELQGIKENKKIQELLIYIFGRQEMPKETYIYLEDYFFADRHMSNDFEIFKQFADIIDRDDLIIKRHPRCIDDRFSPMGYKTVDSSNVPWEIQLMYNDISNKVLLSVSSTSILTSFIMFNSNVHVISFEKMYAGNDLIHQDEGFEVFMEKLVDMLNKKEVYFHTPNSIDELKEVLRYIRIVT